MPTLPASAADSVLDNLVESVFGRIQAGQDIHVEQLASEHPGLESRIRRLVPTLQALAKLEGSLPNGRIESPSGDVPSDLSTGLDLADTGRRQLGDFRIIRRIGRGGMGVVYEAEQISVPRRVALKVLPLVALIDERALIRFHNEVRAAATLDHPHIVPIFNVGEDRGIHFYSMRLIQGRSLAELISALAKLGHDKLIDEDVISSVVSDQQSPEIVAADETDRVVDTAVEAERQATFRMAPSFFKSVARLGIEAASALHEAHNSGVVHRDVKPSNLLIDRDGKLFVADFGLARVGAETGITFTGEAPGTLRYMGPEQFSGDCETADRRTDIYALGATLYELLSFRAMVAGSDRAQIINSILSGEPVRLKKFVSTIPTDLETIISKATRSNPAERYNSAGQFAEDLQRFLENRPVLARRPTLVNGFEKWIRRNPLSAISAVLALVLAVAGLIVSNVLIYRQKEIAEHHTQVANEKTAEALSERKYALAISNFMKDDFLALTSVRGQEIASDADSHGLNKDSTLKEILDRAAGKLDARDDLCPAVVAELNWVVGESYRRSSDFENAVQYLRRSYETYVAAVGENDESTLTAMSSLASAFLDAGEYQTAVEILEQAVEWARESLSEQKLAVIEELLVTAYRKAEKFDEGLLLAEKLYQQSVAEHGLRHSETLPLLTSLANLHHQAGHRETAFQLFELSYKESEAWYGTTHTHTLQAMGNLAFAYGESGDVDEALKLTRRQVELSRELLGDSNPETLQSMNSMAALLQRAGKPRRAIEMFKETLRLQSSLRGETHPETLITMNNLAESHLALGEYESAMSILEPALESATERLGENHEITESIMNRLAGVFRRTGRLKDSLALLRKILEQRRSKLGPRHPNTVRSINNLGALLFSAGQLEDALILIEESAQLNRELLGSDHPATLNSQNNLATLYSKLGNKSKAVQMFQQVVEALESKFGRDHIKTLESIANLGINYKDTGDIENAVLLLQEVEASAAKYPPLTRFRRHLRAALAKAGSDQQLKDQIDHEISEAKEKDGAESGIVAKTMISCSMNLMEADMFEEAEDLLEESLSIFEKVKPESFNRLVAQSLLGESIMEQLQLLEDSDTDQSAQESRLKRRNRALELLRVSQAEMKQFEGPVKESVRKYQYGIATKRFAKWDVESN